MTRPPSQPLQLSAAHLKVCADALRADARAYAATNSIRPELATSWRAADDLESIIRGKAKAAYAEVFGTLAPRQFTERQDVMRFQQKFGVPMAPYPMLLDEPTFEFRTKFMQEELDEFEVSHARGDMHGAADALVDLAYVLHGTALMMGLPWPMLWDEVQRANMTKERATSAAQSKRGSSLDVIKPEGWKGPNHEPALGKGPWMVFVPYGKEASNEPVV